MKKSMAKILGLSVATLFVANVALADNTIDIEQVGPTNNSQTSQDGDLNVINIEQMTNSSDTNSIDILQEGDDNAVTGAAMTAVDAEPDTYVVRDVDTNAYQSTSLGSNSLTVNQTTGGNKIGLSQTSVGVDGPGSGDGDNTASFIQEGDDTAVVMQSAGAVTTSPVGTPISELEFDFGNNNIHVEQLGSAANTAYSYQNNDAAGNSFTLCQSNVACGEVVIDQ